MLMGDFNIDLIKYESSDHVNRFLYQMHSSHFYPLINRPTRITANIKGAVSRNSAKLGNYKMPVKLRET